MHNESTGMMRQSKEYFGTNLLLQVCWQNKNSTEEGN